MLLSKEDMHLQKSCISKVNTLCIPNISMPPTPQKITSGKSLIEKAHWSFNFVLNT